MHCLNTAAHSRGAGAGSTVTRSSRQSQLASARSHQGPCNRAWGRTDVATLSIQQRNTRVSCHSSGRPKTSEVEEAKRGAAHGSSASPARRPGHRLTQGLKLRIKNSVALKRMERMTKYAIFDLNAAWYLKYLLIVRHL